MPKYPSIKAFKLYVPILWTESCSFMLGWAKQGEKLRWFVVDVFMERLDELERKKSWSRGSWRWTAVLYLLCEFFASQRLLSRDDYIRAVLLWAPAKRRNRKLARSESQPKFKLVESRHSCNGGSWLVTATIMSIDLKSGLNQFPACVLLFNVVFQISLIKDPGFSSNHPQKSYNIHG